MTLRKQYSKITPEEFWNEHVGNSVELFVSFFVWDKNPIMDIDKMCEVYAKDICNISKMPYTIETKKHFEKLLKEYVWGYIDKIGGIDKLKIFNRKKLEAIEKSEIDKLLNMLEKFRKR